MRERKKVKNKKEMEKEEERKGGMGKQRRGVEYGSMGSGYDRCWKRDYYCWNT